ncbi:Mo-dependent nitrogenase C-terminal domain-containing protein [Microseira sp. BLCC-F43]|uniref:Mo-dependent nitrogenase C-terminal domain-containing protein n=1 Tax=Microseira sp. BLCC-F43 TaxID=3153602 RepID=UPI0035BAFF94
MESLLQPLRQQLDSIEIRDAELARALCKLIPSQCPFARDIQIFGRTLFRIPPLCKINPLYEQLMGLRFRSLVYLADVCGEDVTPYCY